jgi:cytoskeletal protein CcmA (bactofilin family)
MHARERLVLGGKARVNGNVHYGVIEMAPGAVITGKLIPLGQENGHGRGDAVTNTTTESADATAQTDPEVATAKSRA